MQTVRPPELWLVRHQSDFNAWTPRMEAQLKERGIYSASGQCVEINVEAPAAGEAE
jgi:hypothetical protein